MVYNTNNSTNGWQYWLGVALERINEQRKLSGLKIWDIGVLQKRCKGLSANTLQELCLRCESLERQEGKPFGYYFNAKTKPIKQERLLQREDGKTAYINPKPSVA